jgi:hypothetical protein
LKRVKDRVWVNNKRLRGSVEEEDGKQQKTEVVASSEKVFQLCFIELMLFNHI